VRGEIADEGRLGDLQLEPPRRHPGLQQNLVNQMREIDIVKLGGGHVHRDRQRLRPTGRLTAGRAQNPFADLQDRTAVLRDRNENARRYVATGRMLPAQQGLEADNLAGFDVLQGLINQT
jgi:hypothetical protein